MAYLYAKACQHRPSSIDSLPPPSARHGLDRSSCITSDIHHPTITANRAGAVDNHVGRRRSSRSLYGQSMAPSSQQSLGTRSSDDGCVARQPFVSHHVGLTDQRSNPSTCPWIFASTTDNDSTPSGNTGYLLNGFY